MIKITFLGTGCMQPTKSRNHSGILLRYKSESILLDCGEGIQRQMRIAGIKPARITKVFLSHWHGDHVFGLAGLISTMGADGFSGTLQIYGPPGSKKYMDNLLKSFSVKNLIPIEVREVKTGDFFENEDFILRAELLKHSATCIGFSLIEKDRRRIELTKAKKLGLKGPILGKIQRGEEVTVSGKKIKPSEVTYIVKGKKISYIADTVKCKGADNLAQEADLLISEGTHIEDIKSKTRKYMHLTVKEAAEIASRNKVKRLIITHISQRYKNSEEVLKEAKAGFKNSKVAEDFMEVEV
ncbi:MAG TPA: ribonuclease Z [Candidatus Nanoarchaeia archaeon]|nr:ribonuclease Z [Candidatus Nanoarchaeia archaeon]